MLRVYLVIYVCGFQNCENIMQFLNIKRLDSISIIRPLNTHLSFHYILRGSGLLFSTRRFVPNCDHKLCCITHLKYLELFFKCNLLLNG